MSERSLPSKNHEAGPQLHLTDIYRELVSQKIDLGTAASRYGISTKGLKSRLTKWGNSMPLVLMTLDRIVADAISRDEAAKLLNVTPRNINKLMESWSVQRPVKDYLVNRTISALKWDVRIKYAIDYISGTTSLDVAASGAGISTRQVRRWVTDLLHDYHGIVFKDLAKLAPDVRSRVGKIIGAGQKIDDESERLILAISSDRVKLETEARKRVKATGKSRRFQE